MHNDIKHTRAHVYKTTPYNYRPQCDVMSSRFGQFIDMIFFLIVPGSACACACVRVCVCVCVRAAAFKEVSPLTGKLTASGKFGCGHTHTHTVNTHFGAKL